MFVLDHLRAAMELFYPNLCAGCQNHLSPTETAICSLCLLQLPYTQFPLNTNPLSNRFIPLAGIDGAYSLCYYNKASKLQHMLHALKYKNQPEVGNLLGKVLGKRLVDLALPVVDVVVPLPLHKKRLQQRGYNQAQRIAEGVSPVLNGTMELKGLSRVQHNSTQTHKSRRERIQSMEGAFKADSNVFKEKSILLVDDVITTGATMLSCAEALLDSGCRTIYVASLAYADDF